MKSKYNWFFIPTYYIGVINSCNTNEDITLNTFSGHDLHLSGLHCHLGICIKSWIHCKKQVPWNSQRGGNLLSFNAHAQFLIQVTKKSNKNKQDKRYCF